jgi:hypothetical protein
MHISRCLLKYHYCKNPDNFNGKLSRSSPQFFLVNVTGNEKVTIAAKAISDIMKNFDFASLKNIWEIAIGAMKFTAIQSVNIEFPLKILNFILTLLREKESGINPAELIYVTTSRTGTT